MGEIVQFRPRVKQENSNNRIEALMKGQVDEYTCQNCGEDFEVLFDNKPDRCPHCNMLIEWE